MIGNQTTYKPHGAEENIMNQQNWMFYFLGGIVVATFVGTVSPTEAWISYLILHIVLVTAVVVGIYLEFNLWDVPDRLIAYCGVGAVWSAFLYVCTFDHPFGQLALSAPLILGGICFLSMSLIVAGCIHARVRQTRVLERVGLR